MNIAIFAYSRQGCQTAKRIMACFPQDTCRMYTIERLRQPDFFCIEKPTQPFYGACFAWADALIFVSSCGIAVRSAAPHLKDKQQYPAVIVIDERGTIVIPLLSGHIGGANELAHRLADHLHAAAVITTATDINHKFSADAWAARNGYVIDDLSCAKAVSAAILEQDVPVLCDFPVCGRLPNGVIEGNTGEIGIYIGYENRHPFAQTLRLIPPVLLLGIGCRKGTEEEAIEQAVQSVMEEHHLDMRAVCGAASIDLKAQEAGLLAFCRAHQIPVSFYSAEQLRRVPGTFTSSAFVRQTTGVDNVCERAARIGADHLLVRKTACHGVTVAVAVKQWEVRFE